MSVKQEIFPAFKNFRIARRRSSGDISDITVEEISRLLPSISEKHELGLVEAGVNLDSLYLRRRSSGSICKMSDIPPHICKRQKSSIKHRLNSFFGKGHKEPKGLLSTAHVKITKSVSLPAKTKFSDCPETILEEAESDSDEGYDIRCPKCKEVISNRKLDTLSSFQSSSEEKLENGLSPANRYWENILRHTSNTWMNFNTDNVYCY